MSAELPVTVPLNVPPYLELHPSQAKVPFSRVPVCSIVWIGDPIVISLIDQLPLHGVAAERATADEAVIEPSATANSDAESDAKPNNRRHTEYTSPFRRG